MWRGGVGAAYLFPALSSAGASIAAPCFRFHIPLIEPDVRISRFKCAPAHLMRYVVSPVMWRRADNALAWLVAGPAQRHIRESL